MCCTGEVGASALQSADPGGDSSVVGSPTAALNLRNLGGKRRLVLLNGSRVVPADKAGSVNVDFFPTALMRSVGGRRYNLSFNYSF